MINLIFIFLIYHIVSQIYIGKGQFQNLLFYQSLENDKTSFFVNKPFVVSYIKANVSLVTWIYPADCTLENLSASFSVVTFTCTKPQQNLRFQAYDSNDKSAVQDFYINLEKPFGCYEWYFISGDQSNYSLDDVPTSLLNLVNPFTKVLNGRIWVVDKEFESLDESNRIAVLPSPESQIITKSFQEVGELPNIFSIEEKEFLISSIEYNKDKMYWNIQFSTTISGELPIIIDSSKQPIGNCLIQKSKFILNIKKLSLNFLNFLKTKSTNPVISKETDFEIIQDACFNNLIFAKFSDGVVLVSQNNLTKPETTSFLDFNQIFNQSNTNIIQTTMTSNTTCFLTESGIFCNNYQEDDNYFFPSGISTSNNLNNIRSLDFCSTELESTILNEVFITWSSETSETEIFDKVFLSFNSRLNFTSLNVPLGIGGIISDIVIQPTFNNICILYQLKGMFQILLYNFGSNSFSNGFIFSEKLKSLVSLGNIVMPKLKVVAKRGGELLIWGDGLVYSSNGGITFFKMKFKSRNNLLTNEKEGLEKTEYLKKVITTVDGDIATLTIFFGKSGLLELIEITAGISIEAKVADILFDSFKRLLIYTVNNLGSNFNVRYISINNEIQNLMPPLFTTPLTCGFEDWTSDLKSTYTLDMNENLNFSSKLIPKINSSNKISVSYTNQTITSFKTTFKEEPIWSLTKNGIVLKEMVSNTSTHIKRHIDGRVDVVLRPHAANIACDSIAKRSTVRVGCPLTRKIKFRNSVPTTGVTNLILKSYYYYTDFFTKQVGIVDKEVNILETIDSKHVYYSDIFIPRFDLYDGDKFIKEVTGDIVLFEENLKFSFTYNTTEKQAGCRRKSQNWNSMVEFNRPNPSESWNKSNYIKCYSSELPITITESESSSVYEILSKNNYNGLVWKNLLNEKYIFKVIVIDPEFSFCNLTTKILIEVSGAPMDTKIQLAVIFSLIGSFLIVLAASYAYQLSSLRNLKKEKSE